MASGDDVLGALLLQRRHISPEKLTWAIGEMVREHQRGGRPDLQIILSKHKLVLDNVLRQVGYEARTGGSTFDLDFQSLDWMRKTIHQARQQYGVPQRPPTRPFPSGAAHRAALGVDIAVSSEERTRSASHQHSRRRPTTNRFHPSPTQAALLQQSARAPHLQSTLNSPSSPSSQVPTARASLSRMPAAEKKNNKVWGRYEIDKEIGRGAMGAVYRAFDLEQERREVAIKVLLQGAKAHGDILERFHREARTLARLKHPAIVRVLDNGVYQNRAYIAMEFVAGTPMENMIKDLPLTRGLVIIEEIANALAHAHDAGVVHRDLKPGNIIITTDGKPKIMDFGLAKLLDESNTLTRQGDLVGTPLYMSPEQIRGDLTAMGPMCDLWGLGVSFYLFLTGKLPFNGKTVEEVAKKVRDIDPPEPHVLKEEIPLDLSKMCMTLLNKNAELRYQHASDIAADLRRYLQGQTPTFGMIHRKKEKRSQGFPKSILVVAALALLIGVGAGLAYILSVGNQGGKAASLAASDDLDKLRASAENVIQKLDRELTCSAVQKSSLEELSSLIPQLKERLTVVESRRNDADFPATALQSYKETKESYVSLVCLELITKLTPAVADAQKLTAPSPQKVKSLLEGFSKNPKNRHLRWAKTLLSIQEKDYVFSEVLINELHRDFPSEGIFYLLHADIEISLGNRTEAVQALTKGLRNVKRRSARFALYLRRSALQQKLKQLTAAKSDLNRALQNGFRYDTERLALMSRAVELQDFERLPAIIIDLAPSEREKKIYRLPRAMEWMSRSCAAQALKVLESSKSHSDTTALKALSYWFKAQAKYQLFDHEGALAEVKGAIRNADSAKLTVLGLEARTLYVRLLHITGDHLQADEIYRELLGTFQKRRVQRISFDIPIVPEDLREAFFKFLIAHGDALFFLNGPDSSRNQNSFKEKVRKKTRSMALEPYLQALHLPYDTPAIRRRLCFYVLTNFSGQTQNQLYREHRSKLGNDDHPASLALRGFEIANMRRSSKKNRVDAARLFQRSRLTPRDPELQHCHNYILASLKVFASGNISNAEATRLEQAIRRAAMLEPNDSLTFKYYRRYWFLRNNRNNAVRFGTVSYFLDSTDPDNYFWYASQTSGERRLELLTRAVEYGALASKDSNNPRLASFHFGLARELSKFPREWPRAFELSKLALLGRPQDIEILNFLIKMSGDLKKSEAKEKYSQMLQQTRVSGLKKLKRARKSFEKKDYSAALRQTDQARIYLPLDQLGEYQRLKGESQIRLKPAKVGDSESWKLFCQSAFDDVQNAEALLRAADLGDSSRRQELFNRAKADLANAGENQALEEYQFAVAYHGLVVLLNASESRKVQKRVEREFQKVLTKKPAALGARFIRAVSLILMGAPSDARFELEQLCKSQIWANTGGGDLLHACLALALCEEGRKDPAMIALKKARRLGFILRQGPKKLFRSPAFQRLLKDNP